MVYNARNRIAGNVIIRLHILRLHLQPFLVKRNICLNNLIERICVRILCRAEVPRNNLRNLRIGIPLDAAVIRPVCRRGTIQLNCTRIRVILQSFSSCYKNYCCYKRRGNQNNRQIRNQLLQPSSAADRFSFLFAFCLFHGFLLPDPLRFCRRNHSFVPDPQRHYLPLKYRSLISSVCIGFPVHRRYASAP